MPGLVQEDLVTLVEKRVGADTFLDKIGDIPKHEGFNKVCCSDSNLICNNQVPTNEKDHLFEINMLI